jgi:acyl-CoA synthetase (AMP-forming)/AMP-acid ligase II
MLKERTALASLWDQARSTGLDTLGAFHGKTDSIDLAELADSTLLPGRLDSLRGRSVLMSTEEQLSTAILLLELDGLARRVVLCTPDLTAEQITYAAATAECEVVVSDRASTQAAVPRLPLHTPSPRPTPDRASRRATDETEWILLTSGTTGTPKLVVHTLSSLGGALPRAAAVTARPVWSTFYDIRRYGGLQIYLRAVLGGASLVLSKPAEPTIEFFSRAAAAGVTHISGTPSHWRRTLMSGASSVLQPAYVRLSGETVDQTVLDNLKDAFPTAAIGHAFASTEAGVAFDVNDGLAGFPADYVSSARAGVEMRVVDGTLHIRSARIAARYLGAESAPLQDDEGYVDTGDLVELRGDRYFFLGRQSGVINVGGLKVHPEEVEAVLNADPRVRMSRVRSRRNPILGALVEAEVVLAAPRPAPDATDSPSSWDMEHVKTDLLETCRRALPAHKVPASLRFVPSLELTAAGKLVRPSA